MATSYPARARAIAAAAPIPFAPPVTRAALRVDAMRAPLLRGHLRVGAHPVKKALGTYALAVGKDRMNQEACRKSSGAGEYWRGERDLLALDLDYGLPGDKRPRRQRARFVDQGAHERVERLCEPAAFDEPRAEFLEAIGARQLCNRRGKKLIGAIDQAALC